VNDQELEPTSQNWGNKQKKTLLPTPMACNPMFFMKEGKKKPSPKNTLPMVGTKFEG
jgi:hypothetical protein